MLLVVAEEEPAFENFHLNLLREKILSATGMERINSHCWEEEGEAPTTSEEKITRILGVLPPEQCLCYKVAKTGQRHKLENFAVLLPI